MIDIVYLAYREAGVASWSMEDKRSVALAMWQQALSMSGYVLEYQLAIVSLMHDLAKMILLTSIIIAPESCHHTCQ